MAKQKREKRQVFHVTYDEDHWVLKKEKSNQQLNFNNKQEAISKGKKLAKSTTLGQVIIHKRNNAIQTEYTYRKDPRKIKG